MNWIVENWKLISVSAISALFVWWAICRIHRAFQDRCPHCGSLRQRVDYFLQETADLPACHGGALSGTYHATFKFLTCRHCKLTRCHSRDRFISPFALWYKRTFKSWQFRRTDRIDEMLDRVLKAPSTRCRRTIKIKLPERPPGAESFIRK